MPATAEHISAHDLTPAQRRALGRTPAQALRHGIVQSLPFMLVLVPFGMLFGVVAAEAGLQLSQALGFSVIVLAGASQFTAVQMIMDHAPAAIIILAAVAVNLRMAMYSAALVPWLGEARPRERGLIAYLLIDQTFALSLQHYEKHPRLTVPQRVGYFLGSSIGACLPWIIACALGHVLGRAIPDSLALDFAVPITFLAMIGPMLRTLAHVVAALVAILASLVFAFLPAGTGLFVAAPLAMLSGALVETWTERRRVMRA
ncbi:Predicted branched-chain amino acid permease (azaleucine resistance) [Paracoccus halophilus]|uniref:Branched-chain amino acid transporter AzlC n=1 Tax=Paracoccus halophilus TaxID=376733 RepID=A0A099EY60_9RHOB|nr:AzlC family ABC transporter permease [Paracoccus halophilus]KGJ03149.1 branched-chain amino acid transporter AzlC [Paracoccus halophilus]SFA59083.1 Predicted branched-chain amino acid permease (azaleucine resistance) [Paracoccus halophilus]